MSAPLSTYRLQLDPGFGFAAAAAIVDYLAELGISHVYCSPSFDAVPGSTHGYDVVDPRHLRTELGGPPAHVELGTALQAHGMGQMLDIVPNHMAAHPDNGWWWDVLENGPASPYARFFDIDWLAGPEKAAYSVLAPVLGDHYGRVIESGEIVLERTGGSVVVRYHEHVLPLSPRSLDGMLARAARRAGSAPLARLAEAFGSLPHAALADPRSIQRRHDRKLALAAELAGLCEQDGIAEAVDDELARVAGDPDRLDDLLRRQNFRLAHWRTASEELDHRRFFNIASLVGVRVEDGDVFDATHGLVLELVADGTVSGLRIDHIDGLRDPSSYLDRLARATGGTYTVVEKILLGDERLPDRWPVAGTSGYDFLVRVNDLFVAVENERAMTDLYAELTGEPATFDEVVHESKHQIMREELRAEVEQVTGLLAAVADGERRHRDHTRRELRDALREVVAAFTVYRTYVEPGRPPGAEDRRRIDEAVEAAGRRRPDVDPELLALIGAVARGEQAGGDADELCQRLQQLTAPVTAKGVEDTAFYRYNRLVSLNEVGGDPGRFGREPAEFHRLTAATARRWPETMLTLATHDTKRSADVRARIDVLAELVDEWAGAVHRWSEQDERHRHDGWPERNVAYLLYQTLVGAWPLEPDRAVAYLLKAVREAKVHTSWSDPVAGYEDAVSAFVRSLLGDESFVTDLEAFLAQHDVVGRGRRKALAQTALLLTCPGVPDLYQGSELWDSSLVDPDNRRPVDFDLRRQTLADARGLDAGAALRRIDEGIPKQWMISRLLAHRRREPATYRSSTYEPLAVTGARPDGILAFSRGDLVVVVPVRDGVGPDLAVDLPQGRWLDVLGGASHDGGRRRADALLADFPVAVLGRAR